MYKNLADAIMIDILSSMSVPEEMLNPTTNYMCGERASNIHGGSNKSVSWNQSSSRVAREQTTARNTISMATTETTKSGIIMNPASGYLGVRDSDAYEAEYEQPFIADDHEKNNITGGSGKMALKDFLKAKDHHKMLKHRETMSENDDITKEMKTWILKTRDLSLMKYGVESILRSWGKKKISSIVFFETPNGSYFHVGYSGKRDVSMSSEVSIRFTK